MDIVLLVDDLLLILVGANVLTDSAALVAGRFNISSLIIGLIVVAFGISAPELMVSVVSVLKGSPDIVIGNVVGNNILDVLMIVGCMITIVPISVTRGTPSEETPLCASASIVLFICANDALTSDTLYNSANSSGGILLSHFFATFPGYTFAIAYNREENGEGTIKIMSIWKAGLLIVGGLASLVYRGQFFVDGTSGTTRGLDVSESVTGLTLVAGGTSLLELATPVVAALEENPEMAIGNAIGSSLLNILPVLGCSATTTPMNIQGTTDLDLGVMIGSCVSLHIFGLFFKKRTITRPEGILLIVCYIACITHSAVG